MRFLGFVCATVPLLSLLFVVVACGGADEHSATGSGGQAGSPSSGGSATAGASAGGAAQAGAGAATTGGSASGSATGGASMGGAVSGGSAGATGGTAEGGAAGLYDCDQRKVLCKRLLPECPANQVPSVSGSCYGDCVPIMQCGCKSAAECPDDNQYTCWGQEHCGPFVR